MFVCKHCFARHQVMVVTCTVCLVGKLEQRKVAVSREKQVAVDTQKPKKSRVRIGWKDEVDSITKIEGGACAGKWVAFYVPMAELPEAAKKMENGFRSILKLEIIGGGSLRYHGKKIDSACVEAATHEIRLCKTDRGWHYAQVTGTGTSTKHKISVQLRERAYARRKISDQGADPLVPWTFWYWPHAAPENPVECLSRPVAHTSERKRAEILKLFDQACNQNLEETKKKLEQAYALEKIELEDKHKNLASEEERKQILASDQDLDQKAQAALEKNQLATENALNEELQKRNGIRQTRTSFQENLKAGREERKVQLLLNKREALVKLGTEGGNKPQLQIEYDTYRDTGADIDVDQEIQEQVTRKDQELLISFEESQATSEQLKQKFQKFKDELPEKIKNAKLQAASEIKEKVQKESESAFNEDLNQLKAKYKEKFKKEQENLEGLLKGARDDMMSPLLTFSNFFTKGKLADNGKALAWESNPENGHCGDKAGWSGHCDAGGFASILFEPPVTKGIWKSEELKFIVTEYVMSYLNHSGNSVVTWKLGGSDDRGHVSHKNFIGHAKKDLNVGGSYAQERAKATVDAEGKNGVALVECLREVLGIGMPMVADMRVNSNLTEEELGENVTAVWNHAVFLYEIYYRES
ncbi:MAG TPA: hypothetical protein VGL53_30310, partial [Bryobacteraceae bacterium]